MYTLCQSVCVCVRVYVTVAENIKWYITHDGPSTSLFLALSLSLSDTLHTGTHQSFLMGLFSE